MQHIEELLKSHTLSWNNSVDICSDIAETGDLKENKNFAYRQEVVLCVCVGGAGDGWLVGCLVVMMLVSSIKSELENGSLV